MARANGGNGRVAVAVIGAGIMGSAMARNLAAAGLTTRVWDRAASATGPLAHAGAVVAASARDAVRDAGVVITMLPTANAVESVIFDGQVAEAFVIDPSEGTPARRFTTSRQMSAPSRPASPSESA